jgi:hypothetical protein
MQRCGAPRADSVRPLPRRGRPAAAKRGGPPPAALAALRAAHGQRRAGRRPARAWSVVL